MEQEEELNNPYEVPLENPRVKPERPRSGEPEPPSLDPTALLRELVLALRRVPGVLKLDTYMYNDQGISATNASPFFLDVEKLLSRPASIGFLISDTSTIIVDINKQGSKIKVNSGERLTFSATDPLRVRNLNIESTAATAGVRVFMA
jgi:hypothetical protein